MRRIYITDRRGTPDLLGCIARAANDGVEFIQIREKDLSARDLLSLTRCALATVGQSPVKILVNGRVDIALAAGAHGVHLPGDSPPPSLWRKIVPAEFVIGVSCHSLAEIEESEGADFAVYGPVFESPGKGPAVGLESLRNIARIAKLPVFALGGITKENAQSCIDAGADGIAAIRVFQDSRARSR
jgi:thiamine-phosphate pyrophosphorylase